MCVCSTSTYGNAQCVKTLRRLPALRIPRYNYFVSDNGKDPRLRIPGFRLSKGTEIVALEALLGLPTSLPFISPAQAGAAAAAAS